MSEAKNRHEAERWLTTAMKDIEAAYLDKMYIPTRYPNSIPDVTPDQVYKDWEAELAVAYARSILEEVEAILKV